MLENNIMISVIMPCYNASKYIVEAIQSLVKQTFTDWELVIVDDGSTDGSVQVVMNYVQTLSEKLQQKIHHIQQSNSGACVARNRGIHESTGDYIKFLDADDILMPTCLEEQMQQITQLKENQIPFGYYGNVDEHGTLLSNYQFSPNELAAVEADPINFFFHNWRILITCPLHRKEILLRVGGFDESLKRGQETDLHFRVSLEEVRFMYYPTYTFLYRDYCAQSRISSNFEEGTSQLTKHREKMMIRKEQQLLSHYGVMPKQYHPCYADFWFSQARKNFALQDKKAGMVCLKKAEQYGITQYFQRFYLKFGNIVGYVRLEKVFRWRLKMMHKTL